MGAEEEGLAVNKPDDGSQAEIVQLVTAIPARGAGDSYNMPDAGDCPGGRREMF